MFQKGENARYLFEPRFWDASLDVKKTLFPGSLWLRVRDFASISLKDMCEMYSERIAPLSCSRGERAYYMLMRLRAGAMSIFAPHDLQLLIANIVYRRRSEATGLKTANGSNIHDAVRNNLLDAKTGRGIEKVASRSLVIDDTDLLPAAALLAGDGWQIYSPKFSTYLGPLIENLRDFLPSGVWGSIGDAPDEAVYLCVGDSDFFDRETTAKKFNEYLKRYAETWAILNWAQLGARSLDFFRKGWISDYRLKYVLQAPRPRRERYDQYPAILGFCEDADEFLRLAQISEIDSGPGQLDQSEALKLLFFPPEEEKSIDLPKNALMRDPNLTPAKWLRKEFLPRSEGIKSLGEQAELLRVQLQGKIYDNQLNTDALDKKKQYISGREVSMLDLDPVSGFLPIDAGDDFTIEAFSSRFQSKYVLRKGDILLPFKGSYGSLGKVGFVPEEPEKLTIAAPSICVVRARYGVDPIWLFWFLNRQSTREALRSRAVGSASLTINLKELNTLPIIEPTAEEITALHLRHEGLLASFQNLTWLRKQMSESKTRIMKMMENAAEQAPDESGKKDL